MTRQGMARRGQLDNSSVFQAAWKDRSAIMNGVIETRVVRHEGISLTVIVHEDPFTTPHDADCYTDGDIKAWRADEWRYVGIAVETTMSSAYVCGVEYGRIAGKHIGLDEIIETHVPDLLAEAYGVSA